MNNISSRPNPFDLVKASDFSDEQINQYWVDLAGEAKLLDLFQPTSRTPMLVLGGKGSGKTHLMRYYSSTARKLQFNGDLLKAVQQDGYMGIYVLGEAMNVGRFAEKGAGEEEWSAVFAYHFELWLATHFLRNFQECFKVSTPAFDQTAFIREAKKLFNKDLLGDVSNLDALIDSLVNLRKELDYVVSNIATRRTRLDQIDITLNRGALIFGLPELITKHAVEFKDILFVYMIDEIENFNETQQKFLNTLIRYRKGPVSFKIGARLYGIRTYETIGGSGEINHEGAEFVKIELDAWLREKTAGYKGLAQHLVIKRLQQGGFLPEGDTPNIKVDDYFEDLDSKDNYDNLTLPLVKKYDDRDQLRPYFKTLENYLQEELGNSSHAADITKIISLLKLPEHPLLEKVNVYLLYKDWTEPSGLLSLAQSISSQAKDFLSQGRSAASGYFQALDHYKSDLLAQIHRDCGKPQIPYGGFETLVQLSQGVPRNLIGLLRNVYRRAQFAGEAPFVWGQKISVSSQTKGIHDAAEWFWDDAQPDSHGAEVRKAVKALAEFFNGVRFSLKPAECKLSTFTIVGGQGTGVAQKVLEHAQNWSYLIKIAGGGSDRNDTTKVDDKFQLTPMLAPRWEVSEVRRGAIQLSEAFFNSIFDPAHSEHFEDLKKERLKAMETPSHRRSKTVAQKTLL